MKPGTKAVRALLFVLLPVSGFNQQRLTSDESRKLAVAAMPKTEVRGTGVTIELDREQTQCAIYHAYRLSIGGPPFMTVTVGWWSVDLRTAEVWDELNRKRVVNPQIDAIQRSARRRLRVGPDEISSSISNPCYERKSK
jgi:hypothetical protein